MKLPNRQAFRMWARARDSLCGTNPRLGCAEEKERTPAPKPGGQAEPQGTRKTRRQPNPEEGTDWKTEIRERKEDSRHGEGQ